MYISKKCEDFIIICEILRIDGRNGVPQDATARTRTDSGYFDPAQSNNADVQGPGSADVEWKMDSSFNVEY